MVVFIADLARTSGASYGSCAHSPAPTAFFRLERTIYCILKKGACDEELARFQIEDFENLAIIPGLHV